MKRIIIVVLSCLLFTVVGCNTSSREEVVYQVQQLPDFKEVLQTIEVSSPFFGSINADSANPEFEKKGAAPLGINHFVLYRTKNDGMKIATFNRQRPPVLMELSKEFK